MIDDEYLRDDLHNRLSHFKTGLSHSTKQIYVEPMQPSFMQQKKKQLLGYKLGWSAEDIKAKVMRIMVTLPDDERIRRPRSYS